jgi:hypothetical protein
MHEQEWISPDSFAEEGQADVFGDFGSMDLEGIASGRFGLGRTGFRHSGSSFYHELLHAVQVFGLVWGSGKHSPAHVFSVAGNAAALDTYLWPQASVLR